MPITNSCNMEQSNILYIKHLSIEVTRRCNMSCAHCMRGDAEQTDIAHCHIRNILKHTQHISRFNITGGEPSLVPKTIHYILQQLKSFDITVGNFYLVTNGSLSSISDQFIKACVALYDYQEDKEQHPRSHMLEMSDDRFHDKSHHSDVIEILGRYPFFGPRGQSENIFLFKEGRSKDGYPNPVHPIYLTETNSVYGDVYLNAEGKILGNGDLSYRRQQRHILCDSKSFLKYLKGTLKKRQNYP